MSDSNFLLKIKSLDSLLLELPVTSSTLISDIKNLISLQSLIPFERQRLLYKGKHLNNSSSLASLNITSSSILYLVAYLDRMVEEDSLSEMIRSALDTIPNTYILNRRSRERLRQDLTLSDKLETIRQNLLTIEIIINDNRNFHKGQWVDVKDTVDQWLEAQIIDKDISVNPHKVLIHYNGWPSRWDEWIDIDSSRIQYFKVHTLQSISSPMHSPHPVHIPDSEGIFTVPVEMDDCLIQALSLFEQIQVILGNFNEGGLGEIQERNRIQGILPTVIDRFGKLLCDVSVVIGGMQRNSDDAEEGLVEERSEERGGLQVPVMPTPNELAVMAPRVGSDLDVHIHAFFALRNIEQEAQANMWDP